MKSLLKKCPECGSEMKLGSTSFGKNPRRWECSKPLSFKFEETCFYKEEIPSDYQLSINEMATNIKTSSGFIGSEQLKKDQANVRRILGG